MKQWPSSTSPLDLCAPFSQGSWRPCGSHGPPNATQTSCVELASISRPQAAKRNQQASPAALRRRCPVTTRKCCTWPLGHCTSPDKCQMSLWNHGSPTYRSQRRDSIVCQLNVAPTAVLTSRAVPACAPAGH